VNKLEHSLVRFKTLKHLQKLENRREVRSMLHLS